MGPQEKYSTEFINTINNLFKKVHEKPLFLVGDCNLNSIDYSKRATITNYFDLCFQQTIFTLTNRPTRATKISVEATDHIITNAFLQV